MSICCAKDFQNMTVEQVREYWNRQPCNIRHSTRDPGSREYFDEVEARKYFVEPHIPAFAQFEKWQGKRVLEVGCGIGTDTINFARAGAIVTAVDYSENSLEIARRRAQVYGLKIDFYHANAEELSTVVPIDDYDLVYSFGVIHHTPQPKRVITEIRKYMSPGSELRMMVYNRFSWKVLWILLGYGKGIFWRLDELIARHSEAQSGCPITYTYTEKNVANLLDGFEITQTNIEHIFPYRIADYKNYRYHKVWYFRLMGQRLFGWLEKRLGWHLCVTAKIRREHCTGDPQ
jgi:2-polyprenyl-3-methyl-5-hydroxy-6-metoxy-1,4-benzoquinol methylase